MKTNSDPYRTSSIQLEDKSGKVFSYLYIIYNGKYIREWNSWDGYKYKCIICDTYAVSDERVCTPFKRQYVKGMWWWKVSCPIDGIHTHRKCNRCKANFIRTDNLNFTVNEKIKCVK